MPHATLQKPDEDFIILARSISEQCHLHKTEWDLDNDRLKNLATLLATAESAYEANGDRTTKNAITSANKRAAFVELKHFLGTFISYLKVNHSVPDDALIYMGLRPRRLQVRQPLPRPQEAPRISVKKLHDEMTVYAMRQRFGQSTSSGGLTHHRGFKLRWRYADAEEWREIVTTRLHITLHFNREDEGKRIILSAAWVNPRLQEGPWCEDLSEIVG